MRGGACRVGKALAEKCARLVRQGKPANEINRFFPGHRPWFLAADTGVADICRVLTANALKKRIAQCGGYAIAPKNGTPFCIEE